MTTKKDSEAVRVQVADRAKVRAAAKKVRERDAELLKRLAK